jgi:hypothetical protein
MIYISKNRLSEDNLDGICINLAHNCTLLASTSKQLLVAQTDNIFKSRLPTSQLIVHTLLLLHQTFGGHCRHQPSIKPLTLAPEGGLAFVDALFFVGKPKSDAAGCFLLHVLHLANAHMASQHLVVGSWQQ